MHHCHLPENAEKITKNYVCKEKGSGSSHRSSATSFSNSLLTSFRIITIFKQRGNRFQEFEVKIDTPLVKIHQHSSTSYKLIRFYLAWILIKLHSSFQTSRTVSSNTDITASNSLTDAVAELNCQRNVKQHMVCRIHRC